MFHLFDSLLKRLQLQRGPLNHHASNVAPNISNIIQMAKFITIKDITAIIKFLLSTAKTAAKMAKAITMLIHTIKLISLNLHQLLDPLHLLDISSLQLLEQLQEQ